MKNAIESLVESALRSLTPAVIPESALAQGVLVERTRDPQHGDFASNVALTLAKTAGQNPRNLAQQIVAALPPSELVARAEIAGPGFINFFLTPRAYHQILEQALAAGAAYGRTQLGAGRRVLVEFVSANPTGPLHVGHGRLAAFGATLANLLEAAGYEVEREYYVNDAGRQMNILAVSVWLRYLEQLGEQVAFPSNGYRGDYVAAIAGELLADHGESLRHPASEVGRELPADAPHGDREAHIDALVMRARHLLGEARFDAVLDLALEEILGDIRDDLEQFGIRYDRWYSERSLTSSGAVERALDRLRSNDEVYEQDGALWFRATDFGDEKDRVVVRENGQSTYFASDIAYHLEKRERGFDLLLDVLGADHHGYVARVRAGLAAMGEPPESLEVRLVQFVALYRGGRKVQMSTRSGEFITLRELREEVGNDACRLFYVMRSNDQHLDFDLELAKSHSADNPVYYIQYAHARIASVMRQLAEKGLANDQALGRASLDRLSEDHEKALMNRLSRFPEIVDSCALNRAPHTMVHFLRELANEFHTYYNAHTFIVDEPELRNARLCLITAVQQVIRNGLTLLGVSAPESM